MIFRKENRNLLLQGGLGVVFLGLAIIFVVRQRGEVREVWNVLGDAKIPLVFLGMALTGAYIIMQGLMYHFSFLSIGRKISFFAAVKLFLKRNFISVFLPVGGIASLAFFTKNIESGRISKRQIHFASSIYAFTGILTVFLLAIPVLFYAALKRTVSSNQMIAFLVLSALLVIVIGVPYIILRKGYIYRRVIHWFPRLEAVIEEIREIRPDRLYFAFTLLSSILMEFTGILQLLVAMHALGFIVTPEIIILGYLTSVLFQIISPFMKGLGAIELSLAYVLTRFDFSMVDAISVTLLFRFFQFWLPLLAGGITLLLSFGRKRLFPSS
jgi:phosphatidylglycerol lysyltransferase